MTDMQRRITSSSRNIKMIREEPSRRRALSLPSSSKSLSRSKSPSSRNRSRERPLSSVQVRSTLVYDNLGTTFVVDDKFEYIKQIGHGAYGVVCSAYDHKSKTKVAIKKVPKAFEDLIDAKRIVREIKLLKFFDHENVIAMVDV